MTANVVQIVISRNIVGIVFDRELDFVSRATIAYADWNIRAGNAGTDGEDRSSGFFGRNPAEVLNRIAGGERVNVTRVYQGGIGGMVALELEKEIPHSTVMYVTYVPSQGGGLRADGQLVRGVIGRRVVARRFTERPVFMLGSINEGTCTFMFDARLRSTALPDVSSLRVTINGFRARVLTSGRLVSRVFARFGVFRRDLGGATVRASYVPLVNQMVHETTGVGVGGIGNVPMVVLKEGSQSPAARPLVQGARLTDATTIEILFTQALAVGFVPAASRVEVWVQAEGSSQRVITNVSALRISGNKMIVTLQSAVTGNDRVDVSYSPDPTGSFARSTTGVPVKGFVGEPVTNNLQRTRQPPVGPRVPVVYPRAGIDAYRNYIDIRYQGAANERSVPDASSFSVSIAGASASIASVTVRGSVVRLSMNDTVSPGQAVLVSYSVPSMNRIENLAGDLAASFTDVAAINRTEDESVPTTVSVYVNEDFLTVVYTEALDVLSVPPVSAYTLKVNGMVEAIASVSISGASVDMRLDEAVTAADVVTLSYVKPVSGKVRDTNENEVEGFTDIPVENRTAREGFPPGLAAATITGNHIVLLFNELLDRSSAPPPSTFTVTIDGASVAVERVYVTVFSGRANIIIARDVEVGEDVRLSYDPPDENGLQDLGGEPVRALDDVRVTNTRLFGVGPDGRPITTIAKPPGFDENFPCGTPTRQTFQNTDPGAPGPVVGEDEDVFEWAKQNWPPCPYYEGDERVPLVDEGGKMRSYPDGPDYFPQTGVLLEWEDLEDEQGGRYNIYKRDLGAGVFGYIGSSDDSAFLDDNITPNLAITPVSGGNYISGTNPGCALWFQGRVFFSAFDRNLRAIVASSPSEGGSIRFDRSEPSAPSDAIIRELGSRRGGGVRHLMASQDMIAMTSGEEQQVSGGDDGITPRSLTARVGSAIGVSHVPPIMAREYILMVSYSRNAVWMVRPVFDQGGFETNELTLLVEDIFRGRRIVDWAWADAHSLLFVVMDDGTFFVLLFQPEEEIYAWSHHEIQGGRVKSVAAAYGATTGDAVYFVVERLEGFTEEVQQGLCNLAYLDRPVGYFDAWPWQNNYARFAQCSELQAIRGEPGAPDGIEKIFLGEWMGYEETARVVEYLRGRGFQRNVVTLDSPAGIDVIPEDELDYVVYDEGSPVDPTWLPGSSGYSVLIFSQSPGGQRQGEFQGVGCLGSFVRDIDRTQGCVQRYRIVGDGPAARAASAGRIAETPLPYDVPVGGLAGPGGTPGNLPIGTEIISGQRLQRSVEIMELGDALEREFQD